MADEEQGRTDTEECDHDWVAVYHQGTQDALPSGDYEECSKCGKDRFVLDETANAGGSGCGLNALLIVFVIIVALLVAAHQFLM